MPGVGDREMRPAELDPNSPSGPQSDLAAPSGARSVAPGPETPQVGASQTREWGASLCEQPGPGSQPPQLLAGLSAPSPQSPCVRLWELFPGLLTPAPSLLLARPPAWLPRAPGWRLRRAAPAAPAAALPPLGLAGRPSDPGAGPAARGICAPASRLPRVRELWCPS
nr:translation initiation factor IF-2 [Kogia breviceps]